MRWSIVICTLNRGKELKSAIKELTQLDPLGDNCEIIIVDNGSTDSTGEIVKSIAKTSPNIVSIKEDRIGLSYARNAGIRTARGEFIAFIDDDAWPDRDWLKKLEEGFSDPQVAAVGGKVEPFFKGSADWPGWLHIRLRGFFTVVDYADRKSLHYPNYPAGTNMAFRKSVFAKVGNFSSDLGRTGESLLSMEEADLCLRIERAGYAVQYTPEAVVHHKVHGNRLSKNWLKQRSHWQGISAAIIEKKFFGLPWILRKTLKYSVFILVCATGKVVFRFLRNEKVSFLCDCQQILCLAYLKKVFRLFSPVT